MSALSPAPGRPIKRSIANTVASFSVAPLTKRARALDGVRRENSTCELCGLLASSQCEASRRVATVQLLSPVSCAACGIKFSRLGLLERHIAAAHVDIKAQACQSCGAPIVCGKSLSVQHATTEHLSESGDSIGDTFRKESDSIGRATSSALRMTRQLARLAPDIAPIQLQRLLAESSLEDSLGDCDGDASKLGKFKPLRAKMSCKSSSFFEAAADRADTATRIARPRSSSCT